MTSIRLSRDIISIAPGTAVPLVRYMRHPRRALPDDPVDNPAVARAREFHDRNCVSAQLDENYVVEQAGTPQILNLSLIHI